MAELFTLPSRRVPIRNDPLCQIFFPPPGLRGEIMGEMSATGEYKAAGAGCYWGGTAHSPQERDTVLRRIGGLLWPSADTSMKPAASELREFSAACQFGLHLECFLALCSSCPIPELRARLRAEEILMHTVRMLALGGSLLGLALMAGEAPAQEKSLKETITGAWLVTAIFDEYESGEKKDNWGGQVKGQITFGRTGRFTQIIVGASVPSMKGDDPRKPDAPVVAYYGSYTVDEGGKKIVGKIETASFSPRANTETVWTVKGSGDKLTFVGAPRKDQHGTFTPNLEVRRP